MAQFLLSKYCNDPILRALRDNVKSPMDAEQFEYRVRLECPHYKPSHVSMDSDGVKDFLCTSGSTLNWTMDSKDQQAALYNPEPGYCECCIVNQIERDTRGIRYMSGEDTKEDSGGKDKGEL